MKEGVELGVDGPDKSHGLSRFQARERFPRRGRRRLKARLPILAAAVGTLGHIEWNANESALHLIGESRAARAQHPRSEANDRAPARGRGLYPAEYAGMLKSPETSFLLLLTLLPLSTPVMSIRRSARAPSTARIPRPPKHSL
jgi:hypothetical protein